MLASMRFLAGLFVAGASVFAACGGQTVDSLDAGAGSDAAPTTPTATSTEAGPSEPFDAGGRTCTSTCTQPHQCCQNGCGGVPAATPTSCCTCLSNETISLSCNNNKCGG